MRVALQCLALWSVSGQNCPANENGLRCSGHGSCDTDARCACGVGYGAADCSRKACPVAKVWTYAGYEYQECGNHGTCEFGHCVCHPAWTGNACQRTKCDDTVGAGCSGRGRCVALDTYYTEMGIGAYNAWDHNVIYGCRCDEHESGLGFEGYDCSLQSCPKGDDPLTTGQQNELQLIWCKANNGTFTIRFPSTYHVLTIDGLAVVSDVQAAMETLGVDVKVSFSQDTFNTSSPICRYDVINIVSIEFLQDFGAHEPLLADGTGLYAIKDDAEVKIAFAGIPVEETMSVASDKENLPCSGRGMCDTVTGECACYLLPMPGYRSSDGYGNSGTRGDCGAADDHLFLGNPKAGPTACPGELACSGHGICAGAPSLKCLCSDGWQSGDCSERTCPSEWPWFPTDYFNIVTERDLEKQIQPVHQECANRGICDRTKGECICQTGFEGDACQYMVTCFSKTKNPCSDHGHCISMYEHAADAGYNFSVEYHLPWLTNHYGKTLFACRCEDGYTGYDCSLRTCPHGDYPVSPGSWEKQYLHCYANGGTFKLNYGTETTAELAFDCSAAELKTALEQLNAISTVDIAFSSDTDVMCNNTEANYVGITFNDMFYKWDKPITKLDIVNRSASLPILAPIAVSLVNSTGVEGLQGNVTLAVYSKGQVVPESDNSTTSVVQYTSVQGTRQFLECSGRGVCDHEEGVCQCFTGYSSSNGFGGRGPLADCGFIERHQAFV